MRTFWCFLNCESTRNAAGRSTKEFPSYPDNGAKNNVQISQKTLAKTHKKGDKKISKQKTIDHTHSYETTIDQELWTVSSPSYELGRISVIFVISILIFAKTLHGTFVFDDLEAILNNADVKPIDANGNFKGSIFEIFTNDFWGTPIRSNTSHKSYRPLTVITYRLQAFLAPQLGPLPFHGVNILLHGVVSVLCYFLFGVILRNFEICSGSGPCNGGNKNARNTQFLAATVFAIHPIHCEAVAGLVGRAELLSAVFYLLSLLLFFKDYEEGGKKNSHYFGTIGLAFLAMLAKEQGITVLGVAICYVAVRCSLLSSLVQQFNRLGSKRSEFLSLSSHSMVTMLVLCVAAIVLGTFRLWVMGFRGPQFTALDNPASFLDSWLFRNLNYQYLWCLNLWLMVWPQWLCFDWSMGCVPLIRDWCDARLGAVAGLWVCSGAFAWRVSKESPNFVKFQCFCVVLTVVPFLPASNLAFPVGFVMAERVLYLPSLGICLLGAHWLVRLWNADWLTGRSSCKTFLSSAVVLAISVLAMKSVQRSQDWLTEESLYRTGLSVCPGNAKIRYNLGKVLADAGNRAEAEAQYRDALSLLPNYEQALNNLANVLKDQRKYGEAESLLARAVELSPNFATAWMNLGIVRAALNQTNSAEFCYWRSIGIRPNYADAWFNLGNLMLSQARPGEAMSAWRNATLIQPGHDKAWINMIILTDEMGDPMSSESLAVQAIHKRVASAGVHYALANVLARQHMWDKAERQYREAIAKDPSHVGAHANLGVLYHRIRQYDKAREQYLIALELNPQSVKTKLDLETLPDNKIYATK